MKTTIHSNSGLEITTAMRNYIDGALAKIIESIPEDSSIICSCKIANNTKGFEVTIISREYTVRAENYCGDFYDAVDKSVEKVLKSARKCHKKMIDSKRRKKKEIITYSNVEYEQDDMELLREKKINGVAMSTESALMQLETLDHDFFLYLDSETLLPCVLYKRVKGGVGKLTLVNV